MPLLEARRTKPESFNPEAAIRPSFRWLSHINGLRKSWGQHLAQCTTLREKSLRKTYHGSTIMAVDVTVHQAKSRHINARGDRELCTICPPCPCTWMSAPTELQIIWHMVPFPTFDELPAEPTQAASARCLRSTFCGAKERPECSGCTSCVQAENPPQ